MLILFSLLGCSGHSIKVISDTKIRFSVQIKGVDTVQLVSSSNGYQPLQTEKVGEGRWEIELERPLKQDVMYFYLADGSVYLPACDRKERDDFGGANCVYEK